MGSDETAAATTGGPRVIDVFYGTGRHRVQIAHFFRGQIGFRRPLGVGLVMGKRLHRTRHRCVLSESFESKPRPKLLLLCGLLREIGQKCLKRRRMRCRRLRVYSTDPRRPQGDLRTTNRQDSTGAAAMVASSISRQYRELKKLIFLAP